MVVTLKIRNVLGNQTYAKAARNVWKIRIIGDRHIGTLTKRQFINSKIHFNVFFGANIKRFHHFIQPDLLEDKPDSMLILIRSNDLIHSKQYILNVKVVVTIIIYWKECGVKDIIISFILVKRNFHLIRIIWQINYFLSEYCVPNNFHNLVNDNAPQQGF